MQNLNMIDGELRSEICVISDARGSEVPRGSEHFLLAVALQQRAR